MNQTSLRTVLAAGLLLAALPVTALAAGAPGPGMNLISNPSHEHPGVYFAGRGEINVTWNWVPFWQESPAGTDPRDQNYRTPEFRPIFASQYPERVHNGGGSDRWFNFFALNKEAGIMQEIKNLPVGATVRFTTWAQLWSSNQNTQPARSVDDGNLKIRVCVDQNGGPRDMTDPNLKCSDWAQPYDKWEQISVDAVVGNSTVMALIQSTADIPVEHNDSYADDSCFEILASASDKGICNGASTIISAIDSGAVADVAAAPVSPAAKPAPAATPKPVTGAITAPAGDTPKTAVNTTRLNVRAQASLSGKIVGGLGRGDVVDVTGKSADGKWFQIQHAGAPAWIYASLTLPNAAAQSATAVQ